MNSSDSPIINSSEASQPFLTAYRLPGCRCYYKIRPADANRYWMDISTAGWANRCLPLRMANQHGWEILNPFEFTVEWKDNPQLDALKFEYKSENRGNARSVFGHGIITWPIPYLFVTPPGWNLMVRGPANFWRDGAVPLDGLVETDWLPFTFTMNWRVTRPFKKIKFEADEPMCLIYPVRRHDVESFTPEIKNLESNPDLHAQYQTWVERRERASSYGTRGKLAVKEQGQYIRGEGTDGDLVSAHQTKLHVRFFDEAEAAPELASVPESLVTAPASKPSFWSRLISR
jgi:hypothetical protein